MKTRKEHHVTRLERRSIVQAGLRCGKTGRQIARELDCHEGTVRRDKKVLALPAEDRAHVYRGAAVEPLLRKEHRRKEHLKHVERAKEERQSAVHSSKLVATIVEWFKEADLLPPDALMIVRMVEQRCWMAGMTFYQAARPDADPVDVIFAAQPGPLPPEMPERIDFYAVWLERWLTRVEPNRDIRDRALQLIRQHLERIRDGEELRWPVYSGRHV